MATSALTTEEFMMLWYQSDQVSERKMQKFLLDGLDAMSKQPGKFLSRIKVGPSIATPVVRWMEEWSYPDMVTATLTSSTLTFSGNIFGAATTEDNLAKIIRVGTILQRESDGLQAKVSSVSGLSSLQCTVGAHGDNTLSDDTGAVDWKIISELWSDRRDVDQTRSLERGFREVGTQIHAETFEILKTRKNTKYEIVKDEVNHQIDALLAKLTQSKKLSIMRSEPYYSSTYKYGLNTEEPSMLGIATWPKVLRGELANTNVYKDLSDEYLAKQDLEDVIRNFALSMDTLADYDKGNWAILCHPLVMDQIKDFDVGFRRMTQDSKAVGFDVAVFDSKFGKSFPLHSERDMRPGQLLILDYDAFSYGYYADDKLDRKEISTKGRYQQWLISFQTYGVVCRAPRASVAEIRNIKTD